MRRLECAVAVAELNQEPTPARSHDEVGNSVSIQVCKGHSVLVISVCVRHRHKRLR